METAAFEPFGGIWDNRKCEVNQKRLDGLVWWGKVLLNRRPSMNRLRGKGYKIVYRSRILLE